MNLWADFLLNRGRAVHKWTHYFPIYERHFSRFVNRPVLFWEIGCGRGGSLAMWKRYLGPHARVIGLDIRPECAEFEEDQITVRIGNQTDTSFLGQVLDEFGPPDMILDDGSHAAVPTVTAFKFLYPRIDKNGVYMVEDLHTSYLEKFDGGLGRAGTFIELAKDLIDQLNADYIGPNLRPTEFTRATMSIHFYDSVAVFEKGRTTRKHGMQSGDS